MKKSKYTLKDGPVVIAGNWEPLIFRRRINDPYTNTEELYQQEHTREAVANMKAAGVNLLITHYFKGFGLKAEAEDIKCAKKLIGMCHENGIRVGGYIGDTIILETVLSEEPDAQKWIQFQEDGTPIRFAGTQSFRFKWCMVNPAYFKYMKRVLAQGISDGLDMIHLDNFLNKPEPYSCHCIHCVKAFRKFIGNKHSSKERLERFGHSDCKNIIPPTFITPLYIAWANDLILDPVTQEWIDFKCQVIGDAYRELAEYCKGLKPDIVMECNPTGFWGENSIYMRSVDSARVLPTGSFFWDESPNKYGLQENGALRTDIISMKMGERFSDRSLFYLMADSAADTKRKIGEGLAFNNGCIGMIGFLKGNQVDNHEIPSVYSKYLHDNPDDFCKTRSMAKTALYRNFHSFAYNSYEPYLQAILCQQTLLQKHLLFDLIWEKDNLADYECVILAGIECLNRTEIEEFEKYVKNGGRVVLTDSCGKYDQWHRQYPSGCFDDLKDNCGKGRLTVIPDFKMPANGPKKSKREIWDDCYPVLNDKFWLLPENADEMISALNKNPVLLKTDASKNTIVELRKSSDGRFILVHVINYAEAQGEIKFELNLSVKDIRHINIPDNKEPPIPCSIKDGMSCFKIKNTEIYSYLRLSLV